MLYRLSDGFRIEPLGNAWASFSALSGETVLLNTEAAAILESLASGPADEAQVAGTLANDAQTDVAKVSDALRHVWDQLVAAGLLVSGEPSEYNRG